MWEFAMTIAEKLNEYVNQNGINQVYIAQKTGFAEDTVLQMLNGNRRILADEFLLICVALNIDPNIFRNKSTQKI